MSATSKALSTPEILEQILLQLDLGTLLTTTQLTCRTWTNLIQNSPSLQRALFFLPEPESSTPVEPRINPLLAKPFRPFFPPDVTPPNVYGKIEALVERLSFLRSESRRAAYFRKEASWRRMLVRQPPIMKVAIRTVSGSDKLRCFNSTRVRVPGNVPRSGSENGDENENGGDNCEHKPQMRDQNRDGRENQNETVKNDREIGLRMDLLFDLLILGNATRNSGRKIKVLEHDEFTEVWVCWSPPRLLEVTGSDEPWVVELMHRAELAIYVFNLDDGYYESQLTTDQQVSAFVAQKYQELGVSAVVPVLGDSEW